MVQNVRSMLKFSYAGCPDVIQSSRYRFAPPPCAPSNLGIYPPAQADVIIIILALSPW